MRRSRVGVAAVLALGSVVVQGMSRTDVTWASGAEVEGGGSGYHLRNSLSGGSADVSFNFGGGGDGTLVGDWDGGGGDSLGVHRDNVFMLRHALSGGPADLTFRYGGEATEGMTGDWDGDGVDTIGVRDGNRFHLRNSLTGGPADVSFTYGAATDTPLAGDWDGNGVDTVGIRRGAEATPTPVDCSRLACVALTFDDGPSAHTGRLIDNLVTMGVPATFFLVGEQVTARQSTARRLQTVGMQVENHTWSHPQLPLLSRDGQLQEVRRADDALAAAGVDRSAHLRPPYGSWNADTRTLGKSLILWSVDPRDWDGRTSTQIRSHIVTNTRAGDIVLMHDTVGATVDAVPSIASDLRARGFTLVTVDTLVPGIEAGDIVYSRGQVVAATTQLQADETTLKTPDGAEIGRVVDEAPYPYDRP